MFRGSLPWPFSTIPSKGFTLPLDAGGKPIYDYTIIMLLKHYLPAGVLGLGITALLASFMSGMAGNVSAFNTVWTYDIYQSYIRPRTSNDEEDGKHYLKVGRIATIFGILLSIASAYIASKFGNIMDFLQTIFSMINAPLFAVIFLGMFWKRTTGHAAFTGLACRIPDGSSSSWTYNSCRGNNSCQRRLDSSPAYLSCGNGAELLDRYYCFCV